MWHHVAQLCLTSLILKRTYHSQKLTCYITQWTYGRAPTLYTFRRVLARQSAEVGPCGNRNCNNRPKLGHTFYGYSEKPPHFSRMYDAIGIRRTYSRVRPRVPKGAGAWGFKLCLNKDRVRHLASYICTVLVNAKSKSSYTCP